MGKLSGKPVTPFYLNSSLIYLMNARVDGFELQTFGVCQLCQILLFFAFHLFWIFLVICWSVCLSALFVSSYERVFFFSLYLQLLDDLSFGR